MLRGVETHRARATLRLLLSRHPEIEVVAEGADGAATVAAVREIAQHGLAELARRIRGLVEGGPAPPPAQGGRGVERLLISGTGRRLVVKLRVSRSHRSELLAALARR